MSVEQGKLFEQVNTNFVDVFDRFELAVVDRLNTYLSRKDNGPLLTIDEQDIVLNNPEIYLQKISTIRNPKTVSENLNKGIVTREELARISRAKKALTRTKKNEMFIDRIITSTYAADTCRSLFRVASSGIFIPIEDDDTEQTVLNRTGDYVYDLLRAGRETRLLSGAAMLRTTDKIRHKFDSDFNARLKLVDLAGSNSMKKVHFWIDELFATSKGFDETRIDKGSKNRLFTFAVNRPIEYQNKFDLLQTIADRKNKVSKL